MRQDLITEDIFDRILDDISQFNQNEDVYYMLTGDFIARTSVLDDFLQVDLSLHIPVSDDYKVGTVLDKRVSQDCKVNEYGRKLINLCISTGLRIVNGRLHKIKIWASIHG